MHLLTNMFSTVTQINIRFSDDYVVKKRNSKVPSSIENAIKM